MIRKAQNDDIEKINSLGEQLHQDFNKLFHLEEELEKDYTILLVSTINEEINGYLYAQNFEDNIDLLSIFVDNSYRNKCIGTSLVEKLKEYNKPITLEVKENNIPALNLYKKLGFIEVGVRKKYYNGTDAIVMKWGI